ncbi:glycosyltransferase family 4 protein [candidate division KSB1 bacterium]|nr:glycosyltransferase family 4 protein [candidate division KSB1 bacterium]
MRIVFINSIQMFGGGEIWLLRAMHALSERGHKVCLICRPNVPLEIRAKNAGFTVHTIRMRGDFDPYIIFRIMQILRRFRAEVVCTNMDKELRLGGLAARFAGVKAIVPRRGSDYPLKNTLVYRWSYCSIADGIIANSQSTKQTLLKNAPWLDPEKIRVIYNGIDVRPFQSPPEIDLRESFNIPKDRFLIGFVGLLDERKGVPNLMAAFKLVLKETQNAHLLLAGEGQLETSLREQSRSFRENVTFVGFRDDIHEIMKGIDVLVLPSLWEGFGIVLIEAMAAGTPVITTQISNMPEIVTHRHDGFLVPVNDPSALKEMILRLLSDKSLRDQIGRNGQQTVGKRFTIDRMTDEIEDYFGKLISK